MTSEIHPALPMPTLRDSSAALRTIRSQHADRPHNLFEYNDEQDTVYAHFHPALAHVLHVFHKEYKGIRAACGYLPGNKLAIPADHQLTPQELNYIADTITSTEPSRVVFHGFSRNISYLIDKLHVEYDFEQLYVIMHGTTPQWAYELDRECFISLLHHARRARVKKFHILKAGQLLDSVRQFKPLLYNLNPRIPKEMRSQNVTQSQSTVMVPSWPVLHKNVYTNILGAIRSRLATKIISFAPPLPEMMLDGKEVHFRDVVSRDELFAILPTTDLVLNVSLLDCHPMVNLEAEGFGVPALRGQLFLDANEEHEYVRLTEVKNPFSLPEIADGVDRVLSQSRADLLDVMEDYTLAMNELTISRYFEFLEL